MPRPSWTTSAQLAWLTKSIPEFQKAQSDGTLPTFFTGLVQKWIDEWPLSEPTDEELHKAKYDEEVARNKKIDWWKKVSDTPTRRCR